MEVLPRFSSAQDRNRMLTRRSGAGQRVPCSQASAFTFPFLHVQVASSCTPFTRLNF